MTVGHGPEGEPIEEITLVAADGTRARVLSWGATLRDLEIPLADGRLRRVVLGYEDPQSYIANPSYLGATCGRVANRIRDGRFSHDGRDYDVGRNEAGRTHLHGGARGFSHRNWTVTGTTADSVTLTRHSPDGEEGYPGTVEARCTYRLEAPATLIVEMSATSDAPTPINLAHHSYFTLDPAGTVRELELEVAARRYTPVDENLIPTGELAAVAGTPFDFTRPARLDARGTLYDINYVLDGTAGGEPRFAARASCRRTGLALDILTDAPGLQLYDGQHLKPTRGGLGANRHGPHAGICFEAQNFPDAVNQPGFPSPWIHQGDTYRQVTRYRFYGHAVLGG
ncbi:galactose mutarotase [Ancylobacter sp. VKM B-3255]|uniref:Aldose 1-epimerase n=2 Tax=Ancylobacter radicis TaxID=2836179 RepID=A0ABS5R8U2_9HYPH|nr:galactose mutarotase [Ancylobacter radicis]